VKWNESDVSGRIAASVEPLEGYEGRRWHRRVRGAVRLAILIGWNIAPLYGPRPHHDLGAQCGDGYGSGRALEINLSARPSFGAGIFPVENFEESQVGERDADFRKFWSFSGSYLRQALNAGANGKIRLALLMAFVTARAQCGPVGIAPSYTSRHGDRFQRSSTIGSDTSH
jgi:hypothetical protein